MNIVIARQPSGPVSTIGSLTIDGVATCYTLEDVVREVPMIPVEKWKIKGKTAIPRGKYEVIVNFSNRFQQDMPLLLKVPGFDGVRIHPGNTHADTDGCILPGLTRTADTVGMSKHAYSILLSKIRTALRRGESVTLEVM